MRSIVVALLMFAASLVGTAKAVPYDVPYDVPVGTAKAVANGIGIHEKFKIVGTIAKLHEAQIDVKAVDGATYEIDMDDTTPVTRKMKKVPHGELKPGLRVVVLALGHDMFDLEAFEIQLVD